MRILLVLPPAAGGMLRHVQCLLAGLDPARYDLHVAAAPGPGFDAVSEMLPGRCTPLPLRDGDGMAGLLRASLALARSARVLRPDLIHGHGYRGMLVAATAARLAGRPFVFTAHNLPQELGPRFWRLAGPWCRPARGAACVSEAIARELAVRLSLTHQPPSLRPGPTPTPGKGAAGMHAWGRSSSPDGPTPAPGVGEGGSHSPALPSPPDGTTPTPGKGAAGLQAWGRSSSPDGPTPAPGVGEAGTGACVRSSSPDGPTPAPGVGEAGTGAWALPSSPDGPTPAPGVGEAVTQQKEFPPSLGLGRGERAQGRGARGVKHFALRVIYNGIALGPAPGARIPLPAGRPVVFTAARLAPQKGVAVLIDAWAALAPEFPQGSLLVAGDGPLRAELEAQARALGVADSVLFLGFRDDVRALLRAADVAAIPSLVEGQSLFAVEAMAEGAVVVASRVGGLPEMVREGETGFLVPPGNAEALAGGLRRALGDAAGSARLAGAARAFVAREMTTERFLERMDAFYQECAS